MSGPADDPKIIDLILALPPEERARLVGGLTAAQKREFIERWWQWALPGQLAPPGNWSVWLIRAGRGFGKTRAGAEWVSEIARSMPGARIALVGATADDVRRVMIEGQSGVLSVARAGEAVDWRASLGEVHFPSGARALVYSAEAPEKLRGPEHAAAWCDELAKWRRGDAAWDNLMLGLRLGDRPRALVTTTPRPNALMRRVLALPGMVETRGRTRDNPHLPDNFIGAMDSIYGGTRLGRQELDGELLDDLPGALWTRALIEGCRAPAATPELARVVVGVDPPAGTLSGEGGDVCGIVAVGLVDRDGSSVGYVLEDASIAASSPENWARAVAACAGRWMADRVIVEANNGGAMTESVLRAADPGMPVKRVVATCGKVARAEPVAVLYDNGRVKHAGRFPTLEDQLCGLIVGGDYQGPGRSPDRADALVWAITELLLGRGGRARIRTL